MEGASNFLCGKPSLKRRWFGEHGPKARGDGWWGFPEDRAWGSYLSWEWSSCVSDTILIFFWMFLGWLSALFASDTFLSFDSWPAPHLLTYSLVMSHIQSGFYPVFHTWGIFISLRQLGLPLFCTTVGWRHSLTDRRQSYFLCFQSLDLTACISCEG